jgi:uncharacterized protein (TIGR03437 family)
MKHLRTFFLVAVLGLSGAARAATTIYAATKTGPFKSTDSGVTWKQLIVTSNDSSLTGQPAFLSMAVDPLTPSKVYAFARYLSLQGEPLVFFKSTDAGATWSVVSKPTFSYTFGTTALFAIDSVKTNVFYTMNASDGLEVSTDGGVTWSAPTIPKPTGSPNGGTPNQPDIHGFAVDPNHSGVVYAIGGNAAFHPGKGYFFKSSDFGTTWTLVTSTAGFGNRIFINPKNSQEIYGTSLSNIGCTDANGMCGIYKSTDGGQSWTELNIPEGVVQNIGFDITPGLLYAAAYDGLEDANVYTSVDGGNTWKPDFPDSTALAPSFGMQVVRADPNAASTAYVVGTTDTNIVPKTTDGGLTWKPYEVYSTYQCGGQTCKLGTVIYDLVVVPQGQATVSAAPALTSVVNAAGFQPGIVANSWVTIKGTNLSSTTNDWSSAIVNGALPTSLDGVSVTMGGKSAYMYYVSPGQLNVLAPDIGAGPATVTVTTPGGTGTSFASNASSYGPAFFLWPASQVVATRQDYSYAVKAGTFAGAATVAAKPGEVLILWATGFGPTQPAAPSGQSVPAGGGYSTASAPTVTIGGTAATVYGAALAPGSAGLYQIAIQVPTSLADGDWPIQASIGGVTSPTGVVLSIAH